MFLGALGSALLGKSDVLRLAVTAVLAKGHLLIEDVPGVGKTTLAHAIASAAGLPFRRIQFTADLLPADVLGVSVFNPSTSRFEFHPGPIFTSVLLADEINRATPKTQSALLEAMNEFQVTTDQGTQPLPDPFFVLATQNPFEHHGTFPLPESQMDRFLMRIAVGYPPANEEMEVMRRQHLRTAGGRVEAVLDSGALHGLQKMVADVHVAPAVVEYLESVVRATREHPGVSLGVSTRGAVAWFRACQASALMDGRSFVIPDDATRLAAPVLAHRLVLRGRPATEPGSREAQESVVADILRGIPLPL